MFLPFVNSGASSLPIQKLKCERIINILLCSKKCIVYLFNNLEACIVPIHPHWKCLDNCYFVVIFSFSLPSVHPLHTGQFNFIKRVHRNQSVLSSNPIKGSHCFIEQESLPSLLSTGWFHEQIRAYLIIKLKINQGLYGTFNFTPNKLHR